MNLLKLYFQTLRHLKPIQIWWQIYTRLPIKWKGFSKHKTISTSASVEMKPFISTLPFYSGNNVFDFLNRIHAFGEIDWNFGDFGKLWTYNLNYFEFLNQKDISKEEGVRLIEDFISKNQTLKDGYEPYPVSLRIINWVKFLSRQGIKEDAIDKQLYLDCIRLAKNLEYHLLANHLLENGFGLLFGAYYYRDESLYRKAEKIIMKELREQILSDGAHYELSPMYHQIILSRVLDCYNLVNANNWKENTIKEQLHDTAQIMLAWLENMTFESGEIAMVNDASPGFTPKTKELVNYAGKLGITRIRIPLGASGYRMYKKERFELLCDVGQISPVYQPGHSHADNLNYILHVDGIPLIVDTGISTYDKNERRQHERSTQAHNTIVVNNENSSQIWGGFRIGKRAKTTILGEKKTEVTAQHDGYSHLGILHRRTFELTKTHLLVTDRIMGQYSGKDIRGYLHFHPDVSCVALDDKWLINDQYVLKINSETVVHFEDYQFAESFNKTKIAKRMVYNMMGSMALISLSIK